MILQMDKAKRILNSCNPGGDRFDLSNIPYPDMLEIWRCESNLPKIPDEIKRIVLKAQTGERQFDLSKISPDERVKVDSFVKEWWY